MVKLSKDATRNGSGRSDLPRVALRHFGQLFLGLDNLLHLSEEPRIDHRELVNFLHGKSGPECVTNKENPFCIGETQNAACRTSCSGESKIGLKSFPCSRSGTSKPQSAAVVGKRSSSSTKELQTAGFLPGTLTIRGTFADSSCRLTFAQKSCSPRW